ncbi:hypothetical protein SK128_028651 [Halocaridina rubra]|uniref:Uncharacterized protein n=1 Tax=Halocaridina rubra TaxID=373956 RepID=A0AAN8ZQ43_HALRR
MGVEQWKRKPMERTSGTSSLARSSLRGPGSQGGGQHAGSNHSLASPYHAAPAASPAKHKDSMLDKFKLFNHKDKEGRNKTTSSSGVSKRTSSSSGFSSAKSERSDSSTSLCSDAKPPPLPPHQRKSKIQTVITRKQCHKCMCTRAILRNRKLLQQRLVPLDQ